MKKVNGVQVIALIVVLILLLAGCSESPKRITNWAQNLKAEDITDAVAWTSNFGGNYEDNEVQLSDSEIQELVSIINSLKENDFEYNKHNNGGTPDYGLRLSVGNTDYSFTNNERGMLFEGKQWWIDCKELFEFIAEKSGWTPSPVWDGTVTGTDIKIPIGGGPTSGSNIPSPNVEDDNATSDIEFSERIPVVGLLSGKASDITSVTIEHEDGRTGTLENPQSHGIISTLNSLDAEEVPYPHHLESQQSDNVITITIKYENSKTDIIYVKKESLHFCRMLETCGSGGDLGFAVGADIELLSMLEKVIDQ